MKKMIVILTGMVFLFGLTLSAGYGQYKQEKQRPDAPIPPQKTIHLDKTGDKATDKTGQKAPEAAQPAPPAAESKAAVSAPPATESKAAAKSTKKSKKAKKSKKPAKNTQN